MKSMIKGMAVLISVCVIGATMLGLVNFFTEGKIVENDRQATVEALSRVMRGEPIPTPIDLTGIEKNEIVTEVYKADNGDVAVKMTTKGFKSGLVIMCGVDKDSRVINALCLGSNETYGAEETYGSSFIGKNYDEADEVSAVSGATKTSNAYKAAVKIAIETAKLVKDIPTATYPEDGGESGNE